MYIQLLDHRAAASPTESARHGSTRSTLVDPSLDLEDPALGKFPVTALFVGVATLLDDIVQAHVHAHRLGGFHRLGGDDIHGILRFGIHRTRPSAEARRMGKSLSRTKF